MTRTLVLHQITAMDVPPPDFARMASDAGCEQISVFTNCPDAVLPGQTARLNFPTITPEMMREMEVVLADTGVRVNGVEYFPVLPDGDVRDYARGLAMGRQLGAVRAVTHIHDTDVVRAAESVGRLCDLAAAEGLDLGVEFTPMTRGCPSLERAAWFVDQVGRGNFAIGVDCLHLIRGGAAADDLARLDKRYFNNLQICDGHGLAQADTYMDEAHNRELPGKGDFPLAAIVDALPAHIPIEIEVPSLKYRNAGVTAPEHIRNAVACTKALISTLVPAQ